MDWGEDEGVGQVPCGLFIETCICPRVVNELTTVLSFVIKKKKKKLNTK